MGRESDEDFCLIPVKINKDDVLFHRKEIVQVFKVEKALFTLIG